MKSDKEIWEEKLDGGEQFETIPGGPNTKLIPKLTPEKLPEPKIIEEAKEDKIRKLEKRVKRLEDIVRKILEKVKINENRIE